MNINGVLKQISDQYRGFVLCESCENLFTKQSESWVLANLPKQYGDPCALQDALAPLTPTSGGQRWERYNVSQVQEFDVPKLVYFGMSIFWRSAVYDWKTSTGQKAPTVDLGAYEEPIRQFLLGNSPFPDDVVLTIDIWPYKDVLPLLHPVVTGQLPQGVRRYWFYAPGLHFFLFTGANIPKDARESAATAGFVTLDLDAADSLREFVKRKRQRKYTIDNVVAACCVRTCLSCFTFPNYRPAIAGESATDLSAATMCSPPSYSQKARSDAATHCNPGQHW